MEHENIIILIDLLLLRPQVYRHLLFNKTQYLETGINVTHLTQCFSHHFFFTNFQRIANLFQSIDYIYIF